EPDYWRYFFWVEHIQRFAGAHAQHAAPVWYFLSVLLFGSMPWLVVAFDACCTGIRNRVQHPEFIYLLCWLVLPFVFFSASEGKLSTYILPCFAPLALLTGYQVVELVQAGRRKLLQTNGIANAVFGLLCIVLLFWFVASGQWQYIGPYHVGMGLALLAFAAWCVCGLVQWRRPLRLWAVSAFCPLLLGLLLGWALPQNVIDSKLPGPFIQQHEQVL